MSLSDFFIRRPEFDIFPMRAEHLPAVAALHAVTFKPAWSTGEFHALLLQDSVFGYVARQNNAAGSGAPNGWSTGSATGGFVLVRAGGGEAEILTLAVDPRYRRAGLSWRLMQAALGHARRDAAEAIFLEVDQANKAAIALYGRLGFRKVGERKAYYKPSGKDAPAGGADILRLDL